MVPSMVWYWRALMPINYLYIQLTYLSSCFQFLNPNLFLFHSRLFETLMYVSCLMQTLASLSSFILPTSPLISIFLLCLPLALPLHFFPLSPPALSQAVIWMQCLWREQLKVSQVDPQSGLGETIPLPLCPVTPAKPQDHFSTCSHQAR